jgi:type II restriction enzyme
MKIDIQSLKLDLINTTVPKPVSGTFFGHAAGEPFDKHVYKFVKAL